MIDYIKKLFNIDQPKAKQRNWRCNKHGRLTVKDIIYFTCDSRNIDEKYCGWCWRDVLIKNDCKAAHEIEVRYDKSN